LPRSGWLPRGGVIFVRETIETKGALFGYAVKRRWCMNCSLVDYHEPGHTFLVGRLGALADCGIAAIADNAPNSGTLVWVNGQSNPVSPAIRIGHRPSSPIKSSSGEPWYWNYAPLVSYAEPYGYRASTARCPMSPAGCIQSRLCSTSTSHGPSRCPRDS
jgi:hypothetical protein